MFLSFPFHLPSSQCLWQSEEQGELGRGPWRTSQGLCLGLSWPWSPSQGLCSGLSCSSHTTRAASGQSWRFWTLLELLDTPGAGGTHWGGPSVALLSLEVLGEGSSLSWPLPSPTTTAWGSSSAGLCSSSKPAKPGSLRNWKSPENTRLDPC